MLASSLLTGLALFGTAGCSGVELNYGDEEPRIHLPAPATTAPSVEPTPTPTQTVKPRSTITTPSHDVTIKIADGRAEITDMRSDGNLLHGLFICAQIDDDWDAIARSPRTATVGRTLMLTSLTGNERYGGGNAKMLIVQDRTKVCHNKRIDNTTNERSYLKKYTG